MSLLNTDEQNSSYCGCIKLSLGVVSPIPQETDWKRIMCLFFPHWHWEILISTLSVEHYCWHSLEIKAAGQLFSLMRWPSNAKHSTLLEMSRSTSDLFVNLFRADSAWSSASLGHLKIPLNQSFNNLYPVILFFPIKLIPFGELQIYNPISFLLCFWLDLGLFLFPKISIISVKVSESSFDSCYVDWQVAQRLPTVTSPRAA